MSPSWMSRIPMRILFSACILLVFVFNLNVVTFTHDVLQSNRLKPRMVYVEKLVYDVAPESKTCWFDNSEINRVPVDDLQHLSLLHSACMSGLDDIITWHYGSSVVTSPHPTRLQRGDPQVLEELKRCPDIDIYLPGSLRGSGYCEDGCAYAKYGLSRLLPLWAIEDEFFDPQRNRKVRYHDLCPRTPIIFFNHYWPPTWPSYKPIYLMPNIEMGQLKSPEYWRVDVVICKSRDCHQRVTKWYEQEGNPRGAAVVYTRHTTSDIAGFVRRKLGDSALRSKDYTTISSFTHTAGGSVSKGTGQVIECWLSRPDLPKLDLYMGQGLYDLGYGAKYHALINASSNINFNYTGLDEMAFGKILAQGSVFLCASTWEGYGHYINQARAAGGVIISTNGPPMNELIVAPTSGVYVKTTRRHHPHQIMGGGFEGSHALQGFEGLQADYTATELCEAVDHVLSLTSKERQRMANAAEQAYHDDTKFFALSMRNLRALARAHLNSNKTASEAAVSNWKDTVVEDFPCV